MRKEVRNLVVIVLAMLVSACGLSGGTSTTSPDTTSSTTTSTSEVVDPLETARRAVVRIEAEGSFVDPVEGQMSGAWGGSGFIIDESGLAVTNNHVVTGAALLRVYVESEERPVNAKLLGVSECADLAVIDIDGDGFSTIDWRTETVEAGLPIFALGFPLLDTEYTVLDGVVSKVRVDGETTWSSVDSVIEHSADTLPGNSGGPIVDDEGRVVAVHYAGNEPGQAFAIGGDIASEVVQGLATSGDLETIGINGQAFVSEDGTVSGLWVASVSSGSPADQVGILPGDIITRMEGLTLGRDGTMSDYCDILRTHDSQDPLKVEVLRLNTGELLRGTLNQDELAVVEEEPIEGEASAPESDDYDSFDTLADDSGSLSVSVPTEWSDRLSTSWERDEEPIGPGLSAARDRDGFVDDWTSPGIFIGASRIILEEYGSPAAYLDALGRYDGSCETVARKDYDDGFYSGVYDLYEGCGSTDAGLLQLVTTPADTQDHIVFIYAQAITDADWVALDEALSTFTSTGGF